MLDRTNTYPGVCAVCEVEVPRREGVLLPRESVKLTLSHSRPWVTICRAKQCVDAAVGEAAAAEADRRELRADGSVVMPYDEAALPLLRAIATWDASAKTWRASMLLRDRDVVLAVADRLGLTVAPSFREYEDPPEVQAAVARARAVPTIREYQVEGVRRLAYAGCSAGLREGEKDLRPGFGLFDDQGLGKTLQVLLSLHDDEALLVVCTANAKAVWAREAAKWRPDRFDKVTICEGRGSFRWPASPRELIVINYDLLPPTAAQLADAKAKAEEQLAAAGDDEKKAGRARKKLEALEREVVAGKPSCKVALVADEAHYLENNKAQRTERWRYLSRKTERLYGLTGTPVESDPFKLRGLLVSLRCNPWSWSGFLETFNAVPGQWGGYDFARHPTPKGSTAKGAVVVKPGTAETLQRVMLRRTKAQVLTDLPPKIYCEIPVPLTPQLCKQLDEIAAADIDFLLAGELPPTLAQNGKLRALLAQACIPTMLEIVDSFEQQSIPLGVFSAHRAPIEKLGARKGWFAITGDVTGSRGGKDRRGEIQDRFQAGEGNGVAGTQAMAESMTLTRASHVLFVDRFWTHKHNTQAEDRFHRLGQRDTVTVMILVPDHPLAHHVADLLGSKATFVSSVLEGGADYTATLAARFVDVDPLEYQARIDAKKSAEQRQRERALSQIASRSVTPKQAEERAKLRASRLHPDGGPLPSPALPPTVHAVDVANAVDFMLARCDGAQERDREGFNRPDRAVVDWLRVGVAAGLPTCTAQAYQILQHYPRQLREDFPQLFADLA